MTSRERNSASRTTPTAIPIFRTLASCAVVLAAILVSPAGAATRFWINTGGGDWYDQLNWSISLLDFPPASVPGIGDVATFEIGGRAYTVTFSDLVDLTTVKVPSDTVTFDLEGRELVTTQVIHVGTVFNDIGALTLRNGSVSSPVVIVGFNDGDGRLFVEEDAVLTVEGSLNALGLPLSVGGLLTSTDGLGSMEISGTVNVRDTDSVIGGRLRGVGTATVNGGTWTTDGSLVIGHDGAEGHVEINNGGVVVAKGLTFVGETGRTNAFVDVTGTGDLSITNGTLRTLGTATIGSAENSFGEVDLVGQNSAWDVGGFLFVGEFGIGNMHVRNGADAHVQNDSFISVGANEALLNITGTGSFLNDGSLFVGGSASSAGGPGHLLVQSNGGLEVGGLLKVWETGTLTLDGGTITTGNLMIQPGATVNFDSGRLTIDTGALNIPINFDFGGGNPFDPPEIILLNGALANVTDLSLGTTPGGSSSFQINGSVLHASDDINIGGHDAQSLGGGLLSLTGGFATAGDLIRVWDGGEFNVNSGHITAAEVKLTGGTMTVAGLSSTMYVDASSDFPIGIPGIHFGFAPALTDLTIEDGASLTAPGINFTVATDTSSFAVATVTGPGSSLTAGETHIGNLGDGTINVLDSGSATFTGDLSIGFATNSFGFLLVEGAGTKATSEGKTMVGRQGLGTLMMTLGGSFRSKGDTLIGSLAAPINPAPGFVIVEDSDWVSDGSIYVGGDESGAQAGGGQIFLKPGGTIANDGTMQVWSTGTLSLEGGDLRTRDLLFEAGAGFEMSAGHVTVDGGRFRTPSTSLVFGGTDPTNPVAFSFVNGTDAQTTFAWHLGRNANTFGKTTVSGVARGVRSTLRGTGGGGGADMVVGFFGSGQLDVLDGGLVDFGDDLIIAAQDNATGAVDVAGVSEGFRATIRATRSGGNAAIMVGGKEGTTGGNGDLDVFDGGLVETSGDMFIARNAQTRGDVTLFGRNGLVGEIRVGDDLFLAGTQSGPGGQGDILLSGGGLLVVNDVLKVWPDGFVDMDEGTIKANHLDLTDVEPGSFNFFLGRIEANQISGNLENFEGTLAPVKSGQGAATLDGDYTQFSRAVLEIEMSEVNRATVHDRLDVTGTATLDGFVHVIIAPGFFPAIGETLTIVTHGSRVGAFADVIVEGSVAFDVIYNDNDIQLLVTDADITADLDLDGDVDANDHAVLLACLEGPIGAEGLSSPCLPTDLNGDGAVDMEDFQILQSAFTGD